MMALAARDLEECRTEGLSYDWRLAIAYNSALQSATAALAAAGYRAAREAHHYRVIRSLEYTIGADAVLIASLDAFRKKRNMSDYERAGFVSSTEANDMFLLAGSIRGFVLAWLAKEHPGLAPR